MSVRENWTHAHRVDVAEASPFPAASPGYVDAFAVRRDSSDGRPAEQWARDIFEGAPRPVHYLGLFVWRRLLGFHLGPLSSPDHIMGWRIVTSQPELVHFEARSHLVLGHLVVRIRDDEVVMTTFIHYEKRMAATVVWEILSPLHRRLARYLLEHAADLHVPHPA